MIQYLGIVGSQEKDPAGKDVSLEKFRRTDVVEVFCGKSQFADFSSGIGVPVVIRKGSVVWEGDIAGFRLGSLNAYFTPREYAELNKERAVGVYSIRLCAGGPPGRCRSHTPFPPGPSRSLPTWPASRERRGGGSPPLSPPSS